MTEPCFCSLVPFFLFFVRFRKCVGLEINERHCFVSYSHDYQQPSIPTSNFRARQSSSPSPLSTPQYSHFCTLLSGRYIVANIRGRCRKMTGCQVGGPRDRLLPGEWCKRCHLRIIQRWYHYRRGSSSVKNPKNCVQSYSFFCILISINIQFIIG